MERRLTTAQRTALRIVRDSAPEGPAEFVLLLDSELKLPRNLESSTCDRIISALERQELIAWDASIGYHLTDAGWSVFVPVAEAAGG